MFSYPYHLNKVILTIFGSLGKLQQGHGQELILKVKS